MSRRTGFAKEHPPVNERDLFIAALQIDDAAQRSAYLDKACGADADLRHRVDVLLKAFPQAGSFLQQPAASPDATSDLPLTQAAISAPTEAPGTVIGPYKLLQQIGEGGMGTVFMAEQTEPMHRKVALKIIKPGLDSRQIIARFEAERQALALMDHPNIAKVFDAGTTRQGEGEKGRPGEGEREGLPISPSPCLPLSSSAGRPFFVMELVKGLPITKYCDEH